jgi:hypothetical protein
MKTHWILDPFIRGVTGLPLAVAAIPMALSGHAAKAAALQTNTAARFPAVHLAAGPAGTPRPARVLGHSLVVLLPATLAFAAVAMQLFTAFSGYLYPLRPDTIAAITHPFTPDPEVLPEAWGGPTLAGAWAVHSCVAFAIQATCGALTLALCAAQNHLTRRLLSPASPVTAAPGRPAGA